LRLYLLQPLARIAGEGADPRITVRGEAGEGVPVPSVRFPPLGPRLWDGRFRGHDWETEFRHPASPALKRRLAAGMLLGTRPIGRWR